MLLKLRVKSAPLLPLIYDHAQYACEKHSMIMMLVKMMMQILGILGRIQIINGN